MRISIMLVVVLVSLCAGNAWAQNGDRIERVPVRELSQYHDQCGIYPVSSVFCASAVHRFCKDLGYVVGYPQRQIGRYVDVACFRAYESAEEYVDFGDLRYHDRTLSYQDCIENRTRCRNALSRECNYRGYRASVGIQEIAQGAIIAGCIY